MKKNNLFSKILFSIVLLVFAGVFNSSDAQVVFFPKKQKKSTSVVFFPKKTTPVYRTNVSNLPPGQQKKIYGEKSAKRFAPGQRKKIQQDNWPYISPENKTINKRTGQGNKGKGHTK